MYELVLDGDSVSVPMVPLIANCRLFQEDRTLIARPHYNVRSRVSAASFRVFCGAIDGRDPDITDGNASDLALLCGELKFTRLSEAVAGWRAAGVRLVATALRSQERAVCVLEERVDRMGDVRAALDSVERVLRQHEGAIAAVQREVATVASLRDENRRLAAELDALARRQQEDRQLYEDERRSTARLKEEIAAVHRGLAKLRDEMKALQTLPTAPPSPEEPPPRGGTPGREFPPLVNQQRISGGTREVGVPDGIVAYLGRQCGGNVHDCGVVSVTSSKPFNEQAERAAKNVTEMQSDSRFCSKYRTMGAVIPQAANNWICYDFKTRRIVPTHYAIRSCHTDRGGSHLKSWIVATSIDGTTWTEVDRRDDNMGLNGPSFTATFAVTRAAPCRFIKLMNVGRNHEGDDCLLIQAWEIFGTLTE
jgi:hypothetical protein